jgi:hypothetical protein
MSIEIEPGYYWWKYQQHPWWCGILQVYGVPPFCKWAIICGGNSCEDAGILRIGELSPPSLSEEIVIGPRIEEPEEVRIGKAQ